VGVVNIEYVLKIISSLRDENQCMRDDHFSYLGV